MASGLRVHFRTHLIAYIALFLALTGTATAATNVLDGHGQRVQTHVFAPATGTGFLSTPKVLASIPGMGTLKLLACFDSSGDSSVREQFTSSTATALDVIVDSVGWQLPSGPGGVSMEGTGRVVGAGSGTVRAVAAPGSTVGSAGRMTWQISLGTGTHAKVATITSTILNRSPLNNRCEVAADAMLP